MATKFEIRVENSAPSQCRSAQSVVWACSQLTDQRIRTIVDIGCGRLRNLAVLRSHFKDITLVDTALQCERVRGELAATQGIRLISSDNFVEDAQKYDAAFLISVIHVVDKLSIRKHLLGLAQEKLRDGGFLIIDVPTGEHYYRMHCTAENKYRDGFAMGRGMIRTFYKNYSAKELDLLVKSTTSFSLWRKAGFDHHVVRIWQKLIQN